MRKAFVSDGISYWQGGLLYKPSCAWLRTSHSAAKFVCAPGISDARVHALQMLIKPPCMSDGISYWHGGLISLPMVSIEICRDAHTYRRDSQTHWVSSHQYIKGLCTRKDRIYPCDANSTYPHQREYCRHQGQTVSSQISGHHLHDQ